MLVLGLVPARGGSKGVPNKNVRPFANHNLLHYTARAARGSGALDRLVLSTDSLEIAEAGRREGLEVPFMRPVSLGADDSPMVRVIEHALTEVESHGWSPDIVVLLQPTSPLRCPRHIRDAITMLVESKADSVVTVNELPRDHSADYLLFRNADGTGRYCLPEGARTSRRQDARPTYWRDGTVYAFWRETLKRFGTIYGEAFQLFVLDETESISIDTQRDFDRAEQLVLERDSSGWPSADRLKSRA
jgi:CMP-N,N'-diacetyllegionaminic acid synthase